MSQKNMGFAIDLQNGFIVEDLGELPVAGGDKAAENYAEFIKKNGAKLDELSFTYDCHDYCHIAHPICWVDKKGRHPKPMDVITLDDFKDKKWRFNSPQEHHQNRAEGYLAHLQNEARYVLTIWQPHCIIGSPGNNLHESVFEAMIEWQHRYVATVTKVTKGSNMWTEHYSAMMAAMVDPKDMSTAMNKAFVNMLDKYDNIFTSGLALNFCLASTVLDIIRFNPAVAEKIVLLEDCTAAITGADILDKMTDDFMEEAGAAGMRIAKSTDVVL